MGYFRPEVEAAIKVVGVVTLLTLMILPLAWGYEQQRRAEEWQSLVCAYRMHDLLRRSPIVGRVDHGRDPCAALERLGLALEPGVEWAVATLPRR